MSRALRGAQRSGALAKRPCVLLRAVQVGGREAKPVGLKSSALGRLTQNQTTYELLGTFSPVTNGNLVARIQGDELGRDYIGEKVSGWANAAYL